MTDITYPPSEALLFSTTPQDQFSNMANYSPRNTTGSVFNSTLSYPQGSAMTNSPSYSMDNSPHDTHHHVSLSSQTSKEVKTATTTGAVGNTANFSPPVQATTTPLQTAGRNTPSKEEKLRLEESQRKEAEENQLRLLKEQEERAQAEKAAEEKRLEEEKKKQLLLAKLKAIDSESPSTSSLTEAKPVSSLGDNQPVKKKRLEDILNDGVTEDDKAVVAPATKPFQSESNSLEEKRKKDLLAQLLSTDQPTNSNTRNQQQTDPYLTDEVLTTTGSSTSIKSTSSTGSNYKWNTRVENMHQGKPALATKDDPFGTKTSVSLHKGPLTTLDANTNSQASQRKPSDGGLDFLGGTGGVINTNAYHSKKKDTPTFGRRAIQKPHAVFGSDLTTKIDMPSSSQKGTASTNDISSKSYPWEQEVNVTSERSMLGYHSHNTPIDSSLLPRRTKAQPLSIPGQIDDDIEELSLV